MSYSTYINTYSLQTFICSFHNKCYISRSSSVDDRLATNIISTVRSQSTMDQSNMHRLILYFLLMLLLAVEIHATIVLTPAPQPQPSNTFPMYGATPGSLHPQECGGRCTTRCSKTAFKKPCMFFCQKCCAKCLCVPPGTYGNKQLCPCYNNWKTKRGGPKCP